MTLAFIFVLLCIATCLAVFKYNKACTVTLSFIVACFLAIGYGWVASLLLKPLQVPFISLPTPEWRQQNAIVLLGAGAIKLPVINNVSPTVLSYSRIYTAARLYSDCAKNHSCTIIISGGDANKVGESEAMVYRKALMDLGINSANIQVEPNSMNTYQNAQFTSDILKKNQFDQVILVTSGIHLKRSLLYFAYFGIDATPVAADYLAPLHFSLPLAYNFAITDFALHEYVGIARLYVYNFFGWNKGDADKLKDHGKN